MQKLAGSVAAPWVLKFSAISEAMHSCVLFFHPLSQSCLLVRAARPLISDYRYSWSRIYHMLLFYLPTFFPTLFLPSAVLTDHLCVPVFSASPAYWLFYGAVLSCALQILHFFSQMDGLWQPSPKLVCQHHFSNSNWPTSCLCHFCNSHSIPNFFIITTFVRVTCDH